MDSFFYMSSMMGAVRPLSWNTLRALAGLYWRRPDRDGAPVTGPRRLDFELRDRSIG